MFTWIKRFLCFHIWKDEKHDLLRRSREFSNNTYTYINYKYVAIYQKCLKCGKIKIIECKQYQ